MHAWPRSQTVLAMNVPGKCPSASQVLNELSEGWVEVECPSEQVLKWGLMVSLERFGPQCQVSDFNTL